MNLLKISPSTGAFSFTDFPQAWERYGGRALIARILLDRSDPKTDPLGPGNPLIYAPGLLAGLRITSFDRISIGGKSPLTGGIKEANAGGRTSQALIDLGLRAMLIEGAPAPDWTILHVHSDRVEFLPAGDLVDMGVYQATEILLQRFGTRVAISLIGPGGERGYLSSGIVNLDKDGIPSRISARGGLGAVMGSKRIKAIVFDPPAEPSTGMDAANLRKARQDAAAWLLKNEFVQSFTKFGTASTTMIDQAMGSLPTRNYSAGQFEQAEKLSGEFMYDQIVRRGGKGKPSHACTAGCVVRCSNQYQGEDGELIVSPLEFETIGLLGSNLGVSSLDHVARMNFEINDLGLDTIEIGSALGVAADAKVFSFGDEQRITELVDEIRQGTSMGRLLASGAQKTGEALGVARIPAVKGQAMPAYDPRVLKITGVTYATSQQGADHTAGMALRGAGDAKPAEEYVRISQAIQIENAALDGLGACIFVWDIVNGHPEFVPMLLNARYGWDIDSTFTHWLGEETLKLELEYNRQAGFTSADDRIPHWMTEEPVPPTNQTFDIPGDNLDEILK